MFFKADEALRKLEPHAEWWQILRPLSTTTIFGEQRIDNKRHNLWMCCPEGWLGRVEVICVFDNPNPDNFFFNRDPLVDAILKARKNYQRIEL